jgi:hypothetical protein
MDDGTAIKQLQPVDLRGRPTGEPIAVKDGSLRVQVGAFVLTSFVLDTAE